MSSSQHIQLSRSSIQLPRLFPRQAYQPLPNRPRNAESLSNSTRSENIAHITHHAQNNIARNHFPSSDQACDAEAEFKRYFGRFYKKYCSTIGYTIIFFFILISHITYHESLAVVLFQGLAVVYLMQIGTGLYKAQNFIDKFRFLYKLLEFLGVSALVVWDPFDSSDRSDYLILACIFISYLLKAVLGYNSNRAQFVRFVNQVNKTILGIRACIFVQGMSIILIYINNTREYFEYAIYIIFISHGIIILTLVLFTANLIRYIYFTHKAVFWESAASEKGTGLRWIFGNLFGLISLLVMQLLVFFTDKMQSEMPVFVAIVIYCMISLLLSEYCHDGVFKVCEALAIIIEKQGQKQKKYMTKISNAYFRPATQQEVDEVNDSNINVSGEEDLEACIQVNTDEEKLKCIVCCRKSANAVFMGCGHGGICFSCAKIINKKPQKECHMCRQRISSVLKINIKKNKRNVYKISSDMKNHEQSRLSWHT